MLFSRASKTRFMREAKEKQVAEMQTLASILPDHDRFYGRCCTPFGTIAPQKSRTKSTKEKTLAQLPPMTALCASPNESEAASIQEILDETHCRDCGFLDTL
jgi:hypothetical protein